MESCSFMTLCNCKECGKLIAKNIDSICSDCRKVRAVEIEKIQDWILKEKNPELENIEKDINIPPQTFLKYLLEGKLIGFYKIRTRCDVCKKTMFLKSKKMICPDCQEELRTGTVAKKKKLLEDTELFSQKNKKP